MGSKILVDNTSTSDILLGKVKLGIEKSEIKIPHFVQEHM